MIFNIFQMGQLGFSFAENIDNEIGPDRIVLLETVHKAYKRHHEKLFLLEEFCQLESLSFDWIDNENRCKVGLWRRFEFPSRVSSWASVHIGLSLSSINASTKRKWKFPGNKPYRRVLL